MPQRAKTYRRAGPWMQALVRLHSLGWSDRQVCEALNGLPPQAYAKLDGEGWHADDVEEALSLSAMVGYESNEPRWTIRQVRYYRSRVFQLRHPPRRWQGQARQRYRERLGCAAASAGWGHLVCRSEAIAAMVNAGADDTAVAAELGHGWTPAMVAAWRACPWDMLQGTEARILTTLANDGGAMTRSELMRAVGGRAHGKHGWLNGHGQSWIGLLLRKGLLQPNGWVSRAGSLQPSVTLNVARYYDGNQTPRLDALLEAMRKASVSG